MCNFAVIFIASVMYQRCLPTKWKWEAEKKNQETLFNYFIFDSFFLFFKP